MQMKWGEAWRRHFSGLWQSHQSHPGASALTSGSRSPLSAQPWTMSPYLYYVVLSSTLLLVLPPGCSWALCSRSLVSCKNLWPTMQPCLWPVSYCLWQDFPWTLDLIPCMLNGSSSWWTPLPAPDSVCSVVVIHSYPSGNCCWISFKTVLIYIWLWNIKSKTTLSGRFVSSPGELPYCDASKYFTLVS